MATKKKVSKTSTDIFKAALSGDLNNLQSLLKRKKKPDFNLRGEGEATALMYAAHGWNKDAVEWLLGQGADLNLQDAHGYTALMIASKKGNAEIAKLLIQAKADIGARAEHGLNALMLACQDGSETMVKLLVANKADPKTPADSGATPLHFAAAANHKEIVAFLLQQGVPVDPKEKEAGYTPLAGAARKGFTDVVNLLLESGADVNAHLLDGKTPLMMACGEGHLETAQLLLSHGADVNAVENERGLTALIAAVVSSHENIVRLLLENHANANAQSSTGHTALIYASKNGATGMVRLLLEHGADVFLKNKFREDALMHAKSAEQDEVIELLEQARSEQAERSPEGMRQYGGEALLHFCSLGDTYIDTIRDVLRKGANLEARNTRGFTPLLFASYYRYERTALALIEAGADVNAVEDTGGTPLSWACRGGNQRIVTALLEKGVDIELKDGSGNTPLWNACQQGQVDVVKLLIHNSAKLTPKVWEAAQMSGNPEVLDTLLRVAEERSGTPPASVALCDCNNLGLRRSPSEASDKKLVTIVSEDVHQGWSEIYCVCNTCGRRWKVTEDTGYHYPTYSWEEIKGETERESQFAAVVTGNNLRTLPFSQYQTRRNGLMQSIVQNPTDALHAAEAVLFFDPEDALALLAKGAGLQGTGNPAKAAEILASAATKHFGEAQIKEIQEFLHRCVAAQKWSVVKYGSDFIQSYVGEDPDFLFANGVACGAMGDPAKAQELLLRVVALKPDHYDAWYNLGQCYLQTNRPLDAIPCFRKGLELSPDNHSIQFQLAVAFENSGDKKQALAAYKKAGGTKSSWGGVADFSAQIEEALSRLQGAKKKVSGKKAAGAGARKKEKKGHTNDVESVAISRDGKTVVSGSLDKHICVWDAATGDALMKLSGHTHSVACLAISPDGRHLLSWEVLSNVYILWDLTKGEKIRSWAGESSSIWQFTFSPDSRFVAVEARKIYVVLRDVATGAETKSFNGHTDEVVCTTYHPSGNILASGSRDLTVRIWDANTTAEIAQFKDHASVLARIQFSADGSLFVSTGYDGLIVVRETAGWKEVARKKETIAVKGIGIHPDLKRIFYLCSTAVFQWDITTNVETYIPVDSMFSAAALSFDGTLLATGDMDHKVMLLDLAGPKRLWKA